MLIIIFMAVTSAGSAEFMAVGSLFTFDIYKVSLVPTHSCPTHPKCLVAVGNVLPYNSCLKMLRMMHDWPKP